jgi:phosphoglucosamine mutase
MSNLGMYKAMERAGMTSVKTQVGDRYVVEKMNADGYNLGGEQSGHIVFLDFNTTGDGMLTSLQLLSVMKSTGKKLSELASEIKKYPQRLINVKVRDKKLGMQNEKIQAVIKEVEEQMHGDGRVLVRPSGTEPLLRVMTEAPTQDLVDTYTQKIADVVQEELGVE